MDFSLSLRTSFYKHQKDLGLGTELMIIVTDKIDEETKLAFLKSTKNKIMFLRGFERGGVRISGFLSFKNPYRQNIIFNFLYSVLEPPACRSQSFCKVRFFIKKFFMSPIFNNFSFFKYYYSIHLSYCRKSMSYHNSSLTTY